MIDPAALQMVLIVLTGWLDRREREATSRTRSKRIRLLRRQLGGRRLRLTDDNRRRLSRPSVPESAVRFFFQT